MITGAWTRDFIAEIERKGHILVITAKEEVAGFALTRTCHLCNNPLRKGSIVIIPILQMGEQPEAEKVKLPGTSSELLAEARFRPRILPFTAESLCYSSCLLLAAQMIQHFLRPVIATTEVAQGNLGSPLKFEKWVGQGTGSISE